MSSIDELLALGYRPGAPTPEAEDIDAEVASRMLCPRCGGAMSYESWSRDGSYIALAVCEDCGREVEF